MVMDSGFEHIFWYYSSGKWVAIFFVLNEVVGSIGAFWVLTTIPRVDFAIYLFQNASIYHSDEPESLKIEMINKS